MTHAARMLRDWYTWTDADLAFHDKRTPGVAAELRQILDGGAA